MRVNKMEKDWETKHEGEAFGFELFGSPVMEMNTMFLGDGTIVAHPKLTKTIRNISEKRQTSEDLECLCGLNMRVYPMPKKVDYSQPYVPINQPKS